MTEDDYILTLSKVLNNHSGTVSLQIPKLLELLPESATRLDLEIFPSQEGDGFFSIHASVDGPDLYVINKSISMHASLFESKHTENGIEPPIPIVDPFNTDYPVNDILVDCAAAWIKRIWESLSHIDCPIPVMIVGHDDYGTITPVEIHSGN